MIFSSMDRRHVSLVECAGINYRMLKAESFSKLEAR